MKKIRGKMFWVVIMVVMPGTLLKCSSADLTATVDDQYPWSALAQRKGPTAQDTAGGKSFKHSNEKISIDKFLRASWQKFPQSPAYDEPSFGQQIEDQGPGSIEIYRLTNLDDTDLSIPPLPLWNNPSHREKLVNNKLPTVTYEFKKSHKPGMKKKPLFLRPSQTVDKERKENDRMGVPELQIGCEGLEASSEEFNREPRSISVKNTSQDTYVEVPPVSPIHPVTIDWDYNEDDQPRRYEDMDELLKLKNLELMVNKKIKHRGDMAPEVDSDVEFDGKKVPLRGDLVVNRKVRSVSGNYKNRWNNDAGLWGFGENDGYISEDDDGFDGRGGQTEAQRYRDNYQRAQQEEMDRRRKEQLERQRIDGSRRNDHVTHSEIEKIQKEYELRLSAEQRDRERKLKEYIERNRPIVVENRGDEERRLLEEFRRISGGNGRSDPRWRHQDRSRGPSPPPAYPGSSRVDDARRQEDERRRLEEQRRRWEEIRREDEARRSEQERMRQLGGRHRVNNDMRGNSLEERRAEERRAEERRAEERRTEERRAEERRAEERRAEEKRRAEERRREMERERWIEMQRNGNRNSDSRAEERRREEVERMEKMKEMERKYRERNGGGRREESGDSNRRVDERSRTQTRLGEERDRFMEQKQKTPHVKLPRWEEARLNALPVSARIILVPNSSHRSSTPSPLFPSRGNFGDDDHGSNNPPSACVWAVVQCCPSRDHRVLNSCFEYLGCPGVSWDPNPCTSAISDAARSQVAQFYASADET
uniref:Uncharacterized protein n=1 Tax=Fopius arisanus TaxID=64838 RepID=A0A0C9Q2S3_9HYME